MKKLANYISRDVQKLIKENKKLQEENKELKAEMLKVTSTKSNDSHNELFKTLKLVAEQRDYLFNNVPKEVRDDVRQQYPNAGFPGQKKFDSEEERDKANKVVNDVLHDQDHAYIHRHMVSKLEAKEKLVTKEDFDKLKDYIEDCVIVSRSLLEQVVKQELEKK